ncbi:MAG: ornithine cyclodeaminase, partial [Actinomycetota bacterium]|nr:ornithine cyclodeaminase [Actinomycetota bacterium]
GELARAHVTMMLERLAGLRRLVLFDVRQERASALADRLAPRACSRGVELILARDAEEAVRSAELVVAVTTTTAGYIPMEWLRTGTLLVLVSLDDALPELLLRADGLYVDDWELVRADSRRLLGRMAGRGEIAGPEDPIDAGGRRVDGTLGDVLLGSAPGRRAPEEVIVVNPFGLAIEDVAVAAAVHGVATREHLGMLIPR